METSVVFVCSLFLFVVSTHARVAVPDQSNLITKDEIESVQPNIKVAALDVTHISDMEALTKAMEAITEKSTRKPCSHQAVDVSDNEILPDDIEPCEPPAEVDNGTALLLTPYIKEGRTLEGRKASEVNPEIFLGVRSYSGFFTVNETYGSNMFFWYFPVANKPLNETPWIVWMQGGPGASSMTGLFDEIGPFKINFRGVLERNPYTWLQNHSLVFIENPVGTGYSFTTNKQGYATDMATYTKHLYSTLRQFLQIFPELKTAPLFLAGESYAGKYVPALGMEIHSNRDLPGGDINLKGLIIGNAYVEPGMISNLPTTFYNFGLLDPEQLNIVQPLNDVFLKDIAANRSADAKEKWNELVTVLLHLSSQKQAYNFLRDELTVGKYDKFLKRSDVKRALHVGDIIHEFVNITANTMLASDFISSTRPMIETLLNHYQVLAYCGQLDQMLACPVSSEFHRQWRWDRSDQFLNATRLPFVYRDRLIGYHKSGGRLTEAVIRGAGHMAPVDAPRTMHRLVSRWTHSLPLDTSPYYKEEEVRKFVQERTRTLYL